MYPSQKDYISILMIHLATICCRYGICRGYIIGLPRWLLRDDNCLPLTCWLQAVEDIGAPLRLNETCHKRI